MGARGHDRDLSRCSISRLQRYPGHLEAAQTIAFVTLCTSELIRAFAARSEHHSMFSIGLFSNRWMVAAVALSFVLVLAVVYVPFLALFFDAVPLGMERTGSSMLPFLSHRPSPWSSSRSTSAAGRRQSEMKRTLIAAAEASPSLRRQALHRPGNQSLEGRPC